MVYSLDTHFHITNSKPIFLTDPSEQKLEEIDYKGTFSKGSRIYARVLWDPEQDLKVRRRLSCVYYILALERVQITTWKSLPLYWFERIRAHLWSNWWYLWAGATIRLHSTIRGQNSTSIFDSRSWQSWRWELGLSGLLLTATYLILIVSRTLNSTQSLPLTILSITSSTKWAQPMVSHSVLILSTRLLPVMSGIFR